MSDVLLTRLPLEGPLTIYTAADSKPLLLASLAAGTEVELDLAGVDDFDSAGLQLLLLTRQEALRQGGNLRLVAPSPVVSELLTLAGLQDFFAQTREAVPA